MRDNSIMEKMIKKLETFKIFLPVLTFGIFLLAQIALLLTFISLLLKPIHAQMKDLKTDMGMKIDRLETRIIDIKMNINGLEKRFDKLEAEIKMHIEKFNELRISTDRMGSEINTFSERIKKIKK